MADSLIFGNVLESEALAAVASSGSMIFLLVVFLTGCHPYDVEFVRLYLSFI